MDLDAARKLFAYDLNKVSTHRQEQRHEKEMYWNRVDGERGQWTTEERQAWKDMDRKTVSINEIRPTVKLISGIQRQNRLEIHYHPTEGEDVQTAHLLNAGIKYIGNNNGYEFIDSERFKEGLVERESHTVWTPNFDKDPRGEIQIEKEIPERILWDADSEKYDRSDAERVTRWKWLSPMKIKVKYGIDIKMPTTGELDSELAEFKQDEAAYGASIPVGEQDYSHRTGEPISHLFLDIPRRKVRAVDMWYKKAVNVVFVLNADTGGMDPLFTLPFENEQDAMNFVANLPFTDTTYQLFPKTIERIYLYTFCYKNQIQDMPWGYFRQTDGRFVPYTKRFPVASFYAEFWNGEMAGMVTDLLDPQKERNRRRMQALHILTTLINSGVITVSGTVENPDQLQMLGSRPGVVITLKKGVIIDQVFRRLDPTNWPQGLFQYEQEAKENLREISGANVDLRGIKEGGAEPGYAIALRQRAGLTQVEEYYDNERRTKQIEGHLGLDLMQSLWTYHKFLRIAGEQAVEINRPTAEGIMNDITIGQYDVKIDVSKSAPSLRYANLEQVVMLRRDMQVLIPDQEITELTDIPEPIKQKIITFQTSSAIQRFLNDIASLPPEEKAKVLQDFEAALAAPAEGAT